MAGWFRGSKNFSSMSPSPYATAVATGCICRCRMQPGGVVTRRYGRFIRTEDLSTAAHIKAGTIHAGAALPAGGDATYDGQRGNVLRAAHPLYLYLQVSIYLSAVLFKCTITRAGTKNNSRLICWRR